MSVLERYTNRHVCKQNLSPHHQPFEFYFLDPNSYRRLHNYSSVHKRRGTEVQSGYDLLRKKTTPTSRGPLGGPVILTRHCLGSCLAQERKLKT